LFFVFILAPLPPDVEHDIGREELDHHLPGADGHHLALLHEAKEARMMMNVSEE
jgi:hypothetical protein